MNGTTSRTRYTLRVELLEARNLLSANPCPCNLGDPTEEVAVVDEHLSEADTDHPAESANHTHGCSCALCCGAVHTHEDAVVDATGNSYFFDPIPPIDPEVALPEVAPENTGGTGEGEGGPVGDPASLPKLHSRPNASQKIFLDFDGHVVTNTYWNYYNNDNPIHAPAYSTDTDIHNFSTSEVARIQEIWRRVAEDFAPFDVDVTTEDPGVAAFTAGGQALRVLITTDYDEAQIGGTGNRWFSGAGGVAYLNSWNWRSDTPVWVFENNLGNGHEKYTAEAASHEAGHAFNLGHDGTSSTGYYTGHGSGDTGWAPIMGVGYYRELTQWSRGEYTDANNTQDDVAIIAGKVGFSTDDHGNSIGSATTLTPDSQGNVSGEGIISTRTDVDVFRFVTGSGAVSFDITPFDYSDAKSNLDIQVSLLNSNGQTITSINPSDRLDASVDRTLSAGTYYLRIDGVGKGDPSGSGYSDYGSLGQFYVTGTIISSNSNNSPNAQNDSATTDQGENVSINVLNNDSDPDGDSLSISSVGNAGNGSVSINGTAILYSPDAGFFGTDSFTYTISDGNGGSATATVTVTVNQVITNTPPVARNDSATTQQDQSVTINVLSNDSDADNDPLSISSVGSANNGNVHVNGPSVVYTPNTGFYGNDSFTYSISDGNGGLATATVFVTVNQVISNTPPVARNDSATTQQDQSVTINVLSNDSDADNDPLSISAVGSANNGSVQVNGSTVVYTPNTGFYGTDSFTYTISDGNGGTDQANVTVTVEQAQQGLVDIGETGSVTVNQSNSSQWHSVSFDGSYNNPVVVAGPISFNGGHPTVVRIRNVDADGFEFQLDEWDYKDGGHTTETVGWMVLEAGIHTLSDGTKIEAGTSTVNHSWSSLTFDSSFSATPVVLSQTTTANDGAAVTTRMRNVSSSGFQVQLEEEEAADGTHGNETVSWIAIESGVGTSDGVAFEAGTTGDNVKHKWKTINFGTFDSTPVFLANMQTTDGGDTSALRYRNLDNNSVQIFVEEEQSRDNERNHTTENVGYLLLEPGTIRGQTGSGTASIDLNISDSGSENTTTQTESTRFSFFADFQRSDNGERVVDREGALLKTQDSLDISTSSESENDEESITFGETFHSGTTNDEVSTELWSFYGRQRELLRSDLD